MNQIDTTYYKLMPNVFLAKTSEPHEKGQTIEIVTKRGKINTHIVHNLYAEKNGFYYYSITREDGFNCQTRASNKADKYSDWATSNTEKSNQYYQRSKKDSAFLSLGEPIKVGHHSEKRHRKIIDQAWNNTAKSVEHAEKATNHRGKAMYWNAKAQEVNLSMPESIEYFSAELEKAEAKHKELKDHPEKRLHSYSLTYAKKAVNEMKKKFEYAKKLWG